MADRKVWLVTDGSYSDYRVMGVYSTRKLALAAQDFYQAKNDIEVYHIDALPDHPVGMLPWRVRMQKNGDSEPAERIGGEDAKPEGTWSYSENYIDWQGRALPSRITLTMWARDAEHAVKIANERRALILAHDLWPENGRAYWAMLDAYRKAKRSPNPWVWEGP